jgi:carboxypeptidase family protein
MLVAALCIVTSGCGNPMPTAPDAFLTISGHIYQQETPEFGEPGLSQVLVTVQESGGTTRTAQTNGAGFYVVSVRIGTVSVIASKEGYTTGGANFDLSNNTVLNFSLTPIAD